MAFKVRCPKCQKVYAAETKWIGKRIRCKECGESFTVEEPNEAIDVQATALNSATATHAPTVSSAPLQKFAAKAASTPSSNPVDEPNDEYATRDDEYAGLRPSVPHDFPMSIVVEAWLPLALGLIATVLCVSQVISANETGRTWVSILRFGLIALLYLLLIVPITYKTVAVCFQKLRRIQPPNAMARVAATFAMPTALAVVFWQASGGIGGLITGLIMGLVLMAAVFWLLFRLTPQEAANSYAWTGGLFVGATAIAVLIVIGVNTAVNRAMIDAHAAAFRESPLGAALAWTPPEPAPIKQPAKDVPSQPSDSSVANSASPATVKKTAPNPAPPVKDPPAEAMVTTPATAIPETIPVSSPPSNSVSTAITPPAGAPDSAPLFANPEDDQFVVNLRKKSLPWIKQVSRSNTQGQFDFIVSSCTTAPYVGMVTLDPNSIGLRKFSVGSVSDTGLRRSASFDISDGAGTPRSFSRDYFLTSDGTALLHAQRNEIEIIQTGQNARNTIPLTMPNRQSTAAITPQIVGLARDQSVVVRWAGAGSPEQFVQRYSYLTRKLLESGAMHDCSIASDATAVSGNADGPAWFASILTPDGKRPSLCLYNATSSGGAGGKYTPLPSELSDLTHYDTELVFSPNGTKIVVLFADADHTLVYEWVTATLTSPSMRLSLPPLPVAVSAAHVVGPRVRWIDDLVFIVDGQSVVGTVPNRSGLLGAVSDTPVVATANISKDHILVTYPAEDGFCHASELEFDPAALRNATPINSH